MLVLGARLGLCRSRQVPQALPPKLAAQRGPFLMPIGGPNSTPIERRRERGRGLIVCAAFEAAAVVTGLDDVAVVVKRKLEALDGNRSTWSHESCAAERRDGVREGRPCPALSQPNAVRAGLSARDAGDGV